MNKQTTLCSEGPNSSGNSPRMNDLPKKQPETHQMKNYMVFCPKCHYFVGMRDMKDYYQCSHKKSHKIKKGESK